MTELLDSQFIDWFGGKYDVSTRGAGYKLAYEFMLGKKGLRNIAACIVFASKPPRYLINGVVKKGGDLIEKDKNHVDDRLAKYLPMHSNEEMTDMYDEMGAEEKRKRLALGVFEKVNWSRAKRVALLAFEYGDKDFNFDKSGERYFIKEWISKHGGRPTELDTRRRESDTETDEIFKSWVAQFQNDTAYHRDLEFPMLAKN